MGLVKRTGLVIADRYRLDRQLGAGAMGTVWAAQDMTSGRRVAVKFMSEENPDLRARFVREAKLSKRLSHPNIVTTLEVGETNDGEPFLVQECLTGPTLQEKLKSERQLPPREAARIVRDLALGLAAAHAAEIIHRDLKPANVMLHDPTGNGTEFVVKILDFGIAKSTGSENQTYATVMGMAMGSPAYMSPEGLLARGVDHRSDIWALGVILYELIVGMRPFVGTQKDMANAIFSEEPPLIRDSMRGVPDEVDRIVLMCLQKSREKRLSNAAELASILTQLVESPRVWQNKLATDSKPSDADGDKTLLWRPGQSNAMYTVAPERPGPSLEGVETVVREAPVITSSTRRRREMRMLIGVIAGLLLGVLGMLGLGVALGWFSRETQPGVQVGPAQPDATSTASTNSLEDKRVAPTTVKSVATNVSPTSPSGSVSVAKPVGTVPMKTKRTESPAVAPF